MVSKSSSWIRFLFFVICPLSFSSVAAQDPVLLTVNGMPVSRSEFVYSYQHNTGNGDAERISPEDYLDRFVDYKLKLAAALDAGYELPASAGQQQVLAAQSVNVQDREACYRQACQAAGNADMIYLAQILLKVDTRASNAEVEKVRQHIDAYYRDLSNGADFVTLAQRLSSEGATACGVMGWVGPSQLLEPVEREAYALRAGEMSRPFLTVSGWHVVKVLDRQPATSNVVRQWFLSTAAPQQFQAVPAGNEQLLREYHEGLLVSRITQETVYEQDAPEEKKLQRYFKKNRKRYGKKLKKRDYPQYRDLVLADYLQLREQEWVVDLRHQYKVRIDKRVLKTIE